jgi:ectoine hydroxylase-related dioxygenase (phytanoyl-CoA dioxygenase family)
MTSFLEGEAMSTTTEIQLTTEQLEQFHRDGYFIARGLISREETAQLVEHFMALHDQGVEGALGDAYRAPRLEDSGGDILKHFPRMMHPHKWDEVSMKYMLDERFHAILKALNDDDVLAAQSMLYFKPPGARGQALHQDNFYLKVAPGSCMAAWLSLDDADQENGGMFVVPGSHKLPVLCPHTADPEKSFTVEEVDVPEGMQPVPCDLEAGDVLFFNGSVIHGSYPNTSQERFRRAFICHYMPASSQEISDWYQLWDFDGNPAQRQISAWGGPCGTEESDALNSALQ